MDILLEAARAAEKDPNRDIVKVYAGFMNPAAGEEVEEWYRLTDRYIEVNINDPDYIGRVQRFCEEVYNEQNCPKEFAEALDWKPATSLSCGRYKDMPEFNKATKYSYIFIDNNMDMSIVPGTNNMRLRSALWPIITCDSLWPFLCALRPELYDKFTVIKDGVRIDWTSKIKNGEYPDDSELEICETCFDAIFNPVSNSYYCLEKIWEEYDKDKCVGYIEELKGIISRLNTCISNYVNYGVLREKLGGLPYSKSVNQADFRNKWYAYLVLKLWTVLYENESLINDVDYFVFKGDRKGLYYTFTSDSIKEFIYSDVFSSLRNYPLTILYDIVNEIYLSDKDIFDQISSNRKMIEYFDSWEHIPKIIRKSK